MKPYQLIAALMQRQGLGALPLAKAMNKPKLQPQIHRFIRGEVREPARTTAEPIAAYFGIPTEAIYSEAVATQVASELELSAAPEEAAPREREAPRPRPSGHVVSDEEWALLQDIKLVMSDAEIERLHHQAALLLKRAASVLQARKTPASTPPIPAPLQSVYTDAAAIAQTPPVPERRTEPAEGHRITSPNVHAMQQKSTKSPAMGDRAKRATLTLSETATKRGDRRVSTTKG